MSTNMASSIADTASTLRIPTREEAISAMTMALENNGNRYYQTNQDKDLHEFALFHLWRHPDLNPGIYEELVRKVSSELQQGHAIDPSELISDFRTNDCPGFLS